MAYPFLLFTKLLYRRCKIHLAASENPHYQCFLIIKLIENIFQFTSLTNLIFKMKKNLLLALIALTSLDLSAQDLVSDGANSWILHTPDDGRTSMYIAPKINSNWHFSYQTTFKNNGDVDFTGNTLAENVISKSSFYKSTASAGGLDPVLIGAKTEWGHDGLEIVTLGFEQGISSGTDMDTKIWSYARKLDESRNFITIGRNRIDLSAQKIYTEGKVGIGTTDFTGDHKLRVEGSIGAREIKVEAGTWSDFVFFDNYELRTLEETEQFILENKHLPEIPSAAEVTENGINLGEMNAKLLLKIEELTLYLIQEHKSNQNLAMKLAQREKELDELQNESK